VGLVVDDGKATSCSTAAASAVAFIGDRPSVALQGAQTICVNRVAGFDAQAMGVSKISWDFGDASTWEGGSKASHAYAKPGDYTVTVTADNGQGLPCSVVVSSAKIKVFGSPIADAGQNLVCCVGKVSNFDGSKSASADGSALSYHWDFGDGATADTVQATHAYEKPGSYRVILSVKDSSGSECGTATSSFVANVSAQPQAVIEIK
jgi:PKD repeat protein